MIREGAVPRPGDLLLQAVEGMERPLFVLDASGGSVTSTRPARACSAARSRDWSGRDIWAEFPEAIGTPFEQNYRAGAPRPASRPASRPGSTRWRSGSRSTRSAPRAGLVVTYDDVTARRRTEEERAAAVEAREDAVTEAAAAAAGAEEAGRHLMLLGDINLAMTSTFDTDEAVDRFAHSSCRCSPTGAW